MATEARALETAPLAIETKALSKSFGHHRALRGVELKVKRGEFLTAFGPNGAGKSTLLRVLATICRPTSGAVWLDGLDARKNPLEVKRRIGVVLHQTLLYDDLTAYENLNFYGRMYNVPELDQRIHELVNKVGLSTRLNDQVRTFSRGMQQRLAIARAIIHNPSVLLLDEAETGLDQHATEILHHLLDDFRARRGTVVQTTHSLERGLAFGDRVVILVGGRIVYDESTASLNAASFEQIYYRYTGARL